MQSASKGKRVSALEHLDGFLSTHSVSKRVTGSNETARRGASAGAADQQELDAADEDEELEEPEPETKKKPRRKTKQEPSRIEISSQDAQRSSAVAPIQTVSEQIKAYRQCISLTQQLALSQPMQLAVAPTVKEGSFLPAEPLLRAHEKMLHDPETTGMFADKGKQASQLNRKRKPAQVAKPESKADESMADAGPAEAIEALNMVKKHFSPEVFFEVPAHYKVDYAVEAEGSRQRRVPAQDSHTYLHLLHIYTKHLPRVVLLDEDGAAMPNGIDMMRAGGRGVPFMHPAEVALLLRPADEYTPQCCFGKHCIACVKPLECLELEDGSTKRTSDIPLRAYMSPAEIRVWIKTNFTSTPDEPRPCVLCILYHITVAQANLIGAFSQAGDGVVVDRRWLWQPFQVDPSFYVAEALLPAGNARKYYGLLRPMLRFSSSRLFWNFHEHHGWYIDHKRMLQ